jgi:hypothetical protein
MGNVPSERSASMSLEEFIRENWREIDDHICCTVENYDRPIDDEERRLWVLNDYGLYQWWQECGGDPDEEDDE